MCPHVSTCMRGTGCDCAHRQAIKPHFTQAPLNDAEHDAISWRASQPMPWVDDPAPRADLGWTVAPAVSLLILLGFGVSRYLGWWA